MLFCRRSDQDTRFLPARLHRFRCTTQPTSRSYDHPVMNPMAANKSQRRTSKGSHWSKHSWVSTYSRYLDLSTELEAFPPPMGTNPSCNHRIGGRALAPTPIKRDGGSWYPKRSWKRSGRSSGSPPTRAFAGSKLPWPGPDPRRGTTDGRVSGAACLVLSQACR